MARIASLCPATPAEADIAALYAAASEQWKHCLHLASQPDITPEWAGKCIAQANAMMRQTERAMRRLLRMQAGRQSAMPTPKAPTRPPGLKTSPPTTWPRRCPPP